MTDKQVIHISMLNSYNLITGRASFDEIMDSGVGFFAHLPTDPLDESTFKLLTWYFSEREMFEECAKLKATYELLFNSDGTLRDTLCECNYPVIDFYSQHMLCGECGNLIKHD